MSQDCNSRRPLTAVGPSCNNVVPSSSFSTLRNSSKRLNGGPSIEPHHSFAKRKKDCTEENISMNFLYGGEDCSDENCFPQQCQRAWSKITESKHLLTEPLKYNLFPLFPPASHTPPPPSQPTAAQKFSLNETHNSLPVWDAMRIDDRTGLYSKNFGVDNQHNNFWCASSFEQAAVKVDSIHPGPYFVNFPRLCDHQRLWISHCLGLLADKLHCKHHGGWSYCFCVGVSRDSRYSFCTRATAVLAMACQIFDRFMETVKSHDTLHDLTPKKHILFPLHMKNIYKTPNGILALNYMISVVCYSLADRHEAVRPIDCQSLIDAWQEIVRSNKIKMCNPAAFQVEELHDIEIKILQVLKCQVSNPTPSVLVEELLNPRSVKSRSPAGFGGNKFSARSAEAQLLVRIATIYPKIGLVFQPSIQATAAAQLASEFDPPVIWNDDILQDCHGYIRRTSIERCKALMMTVFLKLYNGGLNKSENINPNDRVWQDYEVDIAKWMSSLNFGNENADFLRCIMERYQTYVNNQAVQQKLSGVF